MAGGPEVALLALGALAVWPVVRAGYPVIGDGLNHFYRLVEFEHLLQHGVWFPRWATDLGYGYGYPLFNYSPPLTYYLGALFGALGLNDANSLLAVYAAGWLLAVSGAYRLARERGSAAAGLIAAAAYGLAPYLYFNALARGALPETLGLGLLPWMLWASYRLTLRPSRGLFLLCALLYASLVITHLLTALLAAPLILLFWLIASTGEASADRNQALSEPPRRLLRPYFPITNYRLPLTLLLALGLSAYFLLPAVLETRLVQIGQLTQPGDLDYHNNFLAVADLLALPSTFDARLVFRAVPPSLSLAALALAVFGLARRAWRARRGVAALDAWDGGLWLAWIGLSLLTLPLSLPIWEHLPGANFIQFPWRLVGPASLLLALLAARAVDVPAPEGRGGVREAPRAKRVGSPPQLKAWAAWVPVGGPALALAGLFFYSLTWTFSAGPPAPAAASVRDLAAYEIGSGQLGTTSAGEFLPTGVRQLPDPHSLEGAYALHSVIERLGPLPPGVAVESQEASVTSAQAVVSAPAPAQLTFNVFDFPGWRATIDGQPAPITASQPNGLITVTTPAGQHTVTVAFGSTPLRTVAVALSFMTAGLLAIVASGRVRIGVEDLTARPPSLRGKREQPADAGSPSPGRKSEQPADAGSPSLKGRGRGLGLPVAALPVTALMLLGLRLAAIDGRDPAFARSRFDGEQVAGVGQAFDANFEDQLVLIGLDLPTSRMAADAALPVTLYWRAQNVPKLDYSTTLQVLDDEGNLWGQSDSQNPGRLPTSRWTTDQYASDTHVLRLLPGTPPGQYRLVAGVYRVGGAALSVLDANRAPQGVTQALATLTVTRAQKPPAKLEIARPANIALGPLTYLGGNVSTTNPQAGDDLTL